MLNVHYTVDVELWCDSWHRLDADFSAAFDSHILGRTPKGDYGVEFQARVLAEHGLEGVFFVEPLFANRLGTQALADIVGMVSRHRQDAQLHVHTEWLDEAHEPLFPHISHKRQHLPMLPLEEQTRVIAEGLRLLRAAGAKHVNAFRAGNFAFNTDTLAALAANGIAIDSSYNACVLGRDSGLRPGEALTEPLQQGGVLEYPVTVYRDGTGRLRPMQITACAWVEMEDLLWKALEDGRNAVVIVSHGFELLDASRRRLDPVALRRFCSLCDFLARHRDSFRACALPQLPVHRLGAQPKPLRSAPWRGAWRIAEQAYRRVAYA